MTIVTIIAGIALSSCAAVQKAGEFSIQTADKSISNVNALQGEVDRLEAELANQKLNRVKTQLDFVNTLGISIDKEVTDSVRERLQRTADFICELQNIGLGAIQLRTTNNLQELTINPEVISCLPVKE